MAVLQLRPTAIPTLSNVSNILKNSGDALNRGFDTVGGVLSSFQSGQEEKADNEVFAEIAKLNSQEEINNFLDRDGIAGRPISKDMRERIAGLRAGVASTNQTIQQTSNLAAGQTIRNAAEGRDATIFGQNQDTRAANIRNAGLALDASLAAQGLAPLGSGSNAAGVDPRATPGGAFVAPGPGTGSVTTANGAVVSPGFAARRDEITGAETSNGGPNTLFGHAQRPGGPFEGFNATDKSVDEILEFQKPDGEYAKYVAANNNGVVATPVGDFQIVGGTLRDAKKGLGLTGNEKFTPALQERLADWIFQTQGSGAFVALNSPTATGGANSGGGQSSASNAIAAASQSDPRRQLAEQQLLDGNLSGPQIAAGFARDTATREGVRVANAATRARAVNDTVNQLVQNVVDNPDTFNLEGARKDLRSRPAFQQLTAPEQNAALSDLERLAGDGGVLNPSLTPSTIRNPSVVRAAEAEVTKLDARISNNPINIHLSRANRLGATPDVAQAFIDEINIPGDGETPEGGFILNSFDKREVTLAIERIVREEGVSPGIAAAALFQSFDRDPFGPNTIGNRLNEDEAKAFVQDTLNEDAITRFSGEVATIEGRKDEIAGTTTLLERELIKNEKLKPGSEKDASNKRIKALRDILRSGNSVFSAKSALAKFIGPKGPLGPFFARNLQPSASNPARIALAKSQVVEALNADNSFSDAEKKAMLALL